MKKILISLVLLLSFSSLNASYLLATKNICIEDYYYKTNKLYYLKSSDNTWYNTTLLNNENSINNGFVFDSNNSICIKLLYLRQLGLDYYSFNFLISMTGLVFGYMLIYMFFIIPLTKKG